MSLRTPKAGEDADKVFILSFIHPSLDGGKAEKVTGVTKKTGVRTYRIDRQGCAWLFVAFGPATMAGVQKQMSFDPNVFVARWYCGEVLPEDMPGFAADALEEGFDGDALRRLAGLVKPTSRDVGDLFARALDEIGTVVVRDKQQAISTLAKVLAEAMVEGKLDPFIGAHRLARYAMEAGYPDELVLFFQFADEPLWGEYARSHDLIRADIIAEAKKLIAR